MRPIGFVSSPRRDLSDDNWGGVVAMITLEAARFGADALAELADFSHLEIVFFMHRVPEDEIESGKRHPRGRADWPEAGIFAQRAKGRPNRIGVSRCRLLSVEERMLRVQGLDAVDGTPVLDIKPYMAEFGPLGEVHQPAWATELMQDYYDTHPAPAGRHEE
ncbi:MAG TPA: SAM-dependent methyltransferase [Dehalococcoidia bacterium]|nr:SAM-dependent methyltransferase [Dehalococcoidia bacterium]